MVSDTLTVLDPRGFPPKVTGRGLAPALDTLAGKNLFLVDIGWENCDVFMQQMKNWFASNRPDVNTKIVRWKDQHAPDPELSDQIRTEGDAAILGVGL